MTILDELLPKIQLGNYELVPTCFLGQSSVEIDTQLLNNFEVNLVVLIYFHDLITMKCEIGES